MKLSVKSDYAARAALGLARHYPEGKALRAEDLAAEQAVPANYLVQILIELKSQGIARSVRGKEGGYLMARPPAQVTLGDILRAVHGSIFDAPALTDKDCPPELKKAWRKLQEALEAASDAINFEQLLRDGGDKKVATALRGRDRRMQERRKETLEPMIAALVAILLVVAGFLLDITLLAHYYFSAPAGRIVLSGASALILIMVLIVMKAVSPKDLLGGAPD